MFNRLERLNLTAIILRYYRIQNKTIPGVIHAHFDYKQDSLPLTIFFTANDYAQMRVMSV